MTETKLALLTAAAAAGAELLPGKPPTILGAPLGMLLAAHAGALFALARTPPNQWGSLLAIDPLAKGFERVLGIVRRALVILLSLEAAAFGCAWAVAFGAPFVVHFFPVAKDAPWPAAAGLLALGGQNLLTRFFEAAGRRIDRFGDPTEGPRNG